MTNTHHPYLNNLTPLRGIAALGVAMYHFEISFFEKGPALLLDKGYMMVDLFFIMSGFIMRHVYGEAFSKRIKMHDLRKFMVARFARIYPLHFFTLVLLILMAALSNDWNMVNDPAAIPTHLLLLQSFGFHKISTWNRLSWSLSAEWGAYVLFPLLAFLCNVTRKIAWILWLFVILLTYIALLYWLPPKGIGNADRLLLHKLDVTYDYGFMRGIAGFSLGMLCYEVYSLKQLRFFFSRDIVAFFCIMASFLCLFYRQHDLIIVLSFPSLVLCFAANGGDLHQLCNALPAQFVGKISYSIYLMQGIVASFFTSVLELCGLDTKLPPLGIAPFSLVLSYMITYLSMLIGISALTYFGIEKPCRNYINRHYVIVAPARQGI